MDFVVAYDTNVGIKKNNNEDSLLLKVVDTVKGKIVFAVVCDGMGGLEFGELASKEVIFGMDEWFRNTIPLLIKKGFTKDELFHQWDGILKNINMKLYEYGYQREIQIGTTITGILITGEEYYALHVGDTRLYKLDNKISCLTQDHSFVQREIANGRMTEEEAREDPRKNILIQAVGTGKQIAIDFLSGKVEKGDMYLLCSDGFRNKIYPNEIWETLQRELIKDENVLFQNLHTLVEENMVRMEQDNITVAAIQVL